MFLFNIQYKSTSAIINSNKLRYLKYIFYKILTHFLLWLNMPCNMFKTYNKNRFSKHISNILLDENACFLKRKAILKTLKFKNWIQFRTLNKMYSIKSIIIWIFFFTRSIKDIHLNIFDENDSRSYYAKNAINSTKCDRFSSVQNTTKFALI